jgi:hypothetical protein
MGLTWPIPKYIQPGAPEFSIYDVGTDTASCPIDGSLAHRIGSCAFDWKCDVGHQFHLPVPSQPGQAAFMSNTYGVVIVGVVPGAVFDQRTGK